MRWRMPATFGTATAINATVSATTVPATTSAPAATTAATTAATLTTTAQPGLLRPAFRPAPPRARVRQQHRCAAGVRPYQQGRLHR